jgi:hypothetical protein
LSAQTFLTRHPHLPLCAHATRGHCELQLAVTADRGRFRGGNGRGRRSPDGWGLCGKRVPLPVMLRDRRLISSAEGRSVRRRRPVAGVVADCRPHAAGGPSAARWVSRISVAQPTQCQLRVMRGVTDGAWSDLRQPARWPASATGGCWDPGGAAQGNLVAGEVCMPAVRAGPGTHAVWFRHCWRCPMSGGVSAKLRWAQYAEC